MKLLALSSPNPSSQHGFCTFLNKPSQSPSLFRNQSNLNACYTKKVGNVNGIRCQREEDGYYMRRCVELARKAVGCTSPNPMVGCVIVKNEEIVGEGFHPKAGQPHAEVFALKDAGALAENATAYVSLEPCNHYGRTPPCSEALIQAKVKHVVVGMVDPNPIVASKGVERLREAGIEVTVGVEEELCRKLNEAYIHRMLTGKPFVTLRYSLSLDGQILNRAIEGDKESEGYYLQLLQEHDGIIISSSTLSRNTDFLTALKTLGRQPVLIIIASASESPLNLSNLTAEVASHAIIFADKNAVIDPKMELDVRGWGTEIVVLDKMDLVPILDYCGRRGLCSVLTDLRGNVNTFHEILGRGLEEGLVQKVVIRVSPVWARNEISSVELNLKIKDLQSRMLKGGVIVEGYFCQS